MINKIKPIYLLILLVVTVVPLVLLLFSLLKSPNQLPSKVIPTTIPSKIPTPIPTLPPGVSELRIIRSAPIQNINVFYLPIQSVELTFTDTVTPQDIKYKIDPHVETTVRQGSIPNALIVRPATKWDDGETTITILTTTSSQSGAKMATPYVYTMRSTIPPAPEGEGNY